jgi:hypothetical protein
MERVASEPLPRFQPFGGGGGGHGEHGMGHYDPSLLQVSLSLGQDRARSSEQPESAAASSGWKASWQVLKCRATACPATQCLTVAAPNAAQAAQAAMPQRMESKGSTDLDTLQVRVMMLCGRKPAGAVGIALMQVWTDSRNSNTAFEGVTLLGSNWMQAQQPRSNLQYASRAFSMPVPGGGLPPPYGGLTFANPGGSSGHTGATAAASAALQVAPSPTR